MPMIDALLAELDHGRPLTVDLRLPDVPLPATNGDSADEPSFG